MKLTLPVTSDSAARLKATELIGEAALTAVFKEGRLAQFLEANVTAYSILAATNNRMPKLLIRDDTVMHGTASSSEVFLEEMARQFQIAIPSPIPVMSPGK